MVIQGWKTRIAVLWLLMVAAVAIHGLLITWEPGGLERMMSRMEAGGAGKLLFEALFSLVPLWLAFSYDPERLGKSLDKLRSGRNLHDS